MVYSPGFSLFGLIHQFWPWLGFYMFDLDLHNVSDSAAAMVFQI